MPLAIERLCKAVGLPEPVAEYRFHPTRKWRFDYCWPDPPHQLALEVQGGIFSGGRHTRGAALIREHEKLNAAAALGYRVVFCTPQDVVSGAVLGVIEPALRRTA